MREEQRCSEQAARRLTALAVSVALLATGCAVDSGTDGNEAGGDGGNLAITFR